VNLFWNELKYFIKQIRSGYPRHKESHELSLRMRPMMSLELEECTREDCIEAALVMCRNHPTWWLGPILYSLMARACRGKAKLSYVVELFNQKEGR